MRLDRLELIAAALLDYSADSVREVQSAVVDHEAVVVTFRDGGGGSMRPLTHNADLFIAHQASETAAHDLRSYSDHCFKNLPGTLNEGTYRDHCVRLMTYIGVLTGIYCGWLS